MTTARPRMLPAAGLLVAGLALSLPGWPQDAVRLRLAALVEQGDLLLKEAGMLEPQTRQLAQLGSQLAAEDQPLEAEAAAVERAVRGYNADVDALVATSGAQRERCASGPLDAQQVRDCNDDAAKLVPEAQSLEQRGVALDQRQQALNQRIDQHNARRLEWDRARREHEALTGRNETEVRAWLRRARAFWSTGEFAALARASASPVACSSARLSVSDTAHPIEALKRMQLCLKAVGG